MLNKTKIMDIFCEFSRLVVEEIFGEFHFED